jgi:hypothetical protein
MLAYNPHPPFLTLQVPTAEESALWHTSVPAVSGLLLSWWQHSHAAHGATETWYVDADARALGLNESRCEVYRPRRAGSSLAALKQMVLRRMLDGGHRFRCIARAAPARAGGESLGDRQPLQQCFEGADTLVAGRPFTAIQFFEPDGDAAGGDDAPPRMRQHHLHYQGVLDTGEPGAFVTHHEVGGPFARCDRATQHGETLGQMYSWRWPCEGECDDYRRSIYRYADLRAAAAAAVAAVPSAAVSAPAALLAGALAAAWSAVRMRHRAAIVLV